jgi:CRP/FNR family transcriptional regulator, dissimilatory nitrate respiration regulator
MSLNVADILHECKLFTQVDARAFTRLAVIARVCKFRKGQVIFRQGDECPGVYVVGKGMVRVFKTGAGGKEHVLHLVGPGETFAEVAAIGGFPVPASAEAVTASTCVLLPQALFKKSLEEDHKLCLGIMTGLTFWVKHLVGLMEDIVLRDAAGRLARYLLEAPRADDGTITLPSLKRHLASHLDLTSETFSRTLRRMVDSGLVAEVEHGRLRLLDRSSLRRVAEGVFPRL